MTQGLQMEIPTTMTAWCMPCRAQRVIENPKPKYIRGARGLRLQLQGKCPDCGAVVNRFLKSKGRDVPPPPPDLEETLPKERPKGVTGHPGPSLQVVTYYRGMCQRCRTERRFTGNPVGTRYDGKKVIRGKCLTCEQPQVVVGVQEEEENGE